MSVELVDRLSILVAVRRFPSLQNLGYCGLTFMSVCNISFVDLLLFPFEDFWGIHMRREFMQRLSPALHGTLGSYLRDALGRADALACLPVP
jgi:hypothetical protein